MAAARDGVAALGATTVVVDIAALELTELPVVGEVPAELATPTAAPDGDVEEDGVVLR